MDDSYYYNAVALACGGDYVKIARAKKSRASWQDAWKTSTELGNINPEQAWDQLQKHGIAICMRESNEFPALLNEIHHPPFALYIKGALPKLHALAIVGTRKATASGRATAEQFAESLAGAGWCITSGLALGIDGAAHTGALKAKGATVAVLACGLDEVYPSEHASLAARIITEGGALISEYPIGSPCYQARFLERNRIVSGLSLGALIIEAPERSGSIATATFALQQNRDVFVIPGPVGHPNFSGSHALIKTGAALVTTPDDIRAAFGEDVSPAKASTAKAAELSGDEARIYEALKNSAATATVDKLSEIVQLPSYAVSRALTFMQLKGIIRECDGTYELS
ncbi:MAG: DNA-processing protein DprA [bacterium]|nr:DNA-processing protein DprA [bacterium]